MKRKRQALSSSAPYGLLALHLLRSWRKSGVGGLVFVAADGARAERLGAVLHALDGGCNVLVLPQLDALPIDEVEPSRDISGRRATVLRQLAERRSPPLLVTTVDAMLPRVPRPQGWTRACLRLAPGQSVDLDALQTFLADAGYDLDAPADDPGGALFHGQTIEIFPAGALSPVRIEHQDGVIQAIHRIDLAHQAALAGLDALVLDPMSERGLGADGADRRASTSIFAYLDSAAMIADAKVPEEAERRLAAIAESTADGAAGAFVSPREWQQVARRMVVLPASSAIEAIPNFSRAASASVALRSFVAARSRDGWRIMFTAGNDRDLRRMEHLAGLQTLRCRDWARASRPPPGKITSMLIDLDAGFRTGTTRPLAVITAADVLGSRAYHLAPMSRQHSASADGAARPALGGAVIHLQRGVAVLRGLERVATPGLSEHEMLRLGFADNETVLAPVAELALIWPYAGDPAEIKLDSADGGSWTARRDEAEREIERTARTLSQSILDRRRATAPRLVPPAAIYERFVARFPYLATPDQANAVEDVLKDLGSGHPMDRIVCGDVGFGKTEVALRAAAAAVFSGKQAALAVPTTVLARQHVLTFRKRFAPFDIAVGQLSRLTPATEARAIKQQLRDGSLKLVIGTHALAGKDVTFADLGLVIIDEEQHFGAADKAKLSALRDGIHTLTMSATPIPRTVAAAMAGLRDYSVISTPPTQRLSIVTKVLPFLDSTLAMALRREQRRRGQSFVICPRIRELEPTLERLRRTAPELRVVTVHGRLPASEIDDSMMRFIAGEVDVLLATDIIENGLDIPRANTIVICSPERFGLAQLHQLRGRVGRGATRAFAYLLTDGPGEEAQKRIAAIEELSRPGAGFQISARDLDLRGAGDLLSDQQTGHLQMFGPALYNDLLTHALQGKPRRLADSWVVELHIDVAAELPSSYVQDEATRLDLHTRLAKARGQADIAEIGDEMELRFGPLPLEVSHLLATAEIRLDCHALGIERIDAGPAGVAARLRPGVTVACRSRLIARKDERLVFKHRIKDGETLKVVIGFVELLKRACSDVPARRPASRRKDDGRAAAR